MSVSVSAPAFVTRFKCLGADCEDTCCKGWGMQVDAPTLERYRKQAPHLLDSVTGEGSAAIMKRDARTDFCIKFDNGLCGIQRNHGEPFLGDACYFYPRSTRALGKDVTMTATLSCPEVVRLALYAEDGFAPSSLTAERLPQSLQDYLPEGMTAAQAATIHGRFIEEALTPGLAPDRAFMRIFRASESLDRVTTASWPDAAPFYLQHADLTLPPPEPRPTDPAFLLQALCGLIAAAKYVHHKRLMDTIRDMENALHLTIRWDDNLAIAALPDCGPAIEALHVRWRNEWQERYAPLLKRYLAMQLSLALFPFAGFGHTLPQRIAVIGIRLATVRLALMSVCQAANGTPAERDVVRVIQSLSRFLDHLATADFSIKIYEETGWLRGGRLRALLS